MFTRITLKNSFFKEKENQWALVLFSYQERR